jgi:hypothetical protein
MLRRLKRNKHLQQNYRIFELELQGFKTRENPVNPALTALGKLGFVQHALLAVGSGE